MITGATCKIRQVIRARRPDIDLTYNDRTKSKQTARYGLYLLATQNSFPMRLIALNSTILHVAVHTSRARHWFFFPVVLSCLAGAFLIVASGCATTHTERSNAPLKLEVDTAAQIWLDGEPYAINRLPAALKRHRIPLKQPLLIHTPEGDNRALYVRVSSVLRSAGYTRFFFVGDPQAEASIVTSKPVVTPRSVTPKRFSR